MHGCRCAGMPPWNPDLLPGPSPRPPLNIPASGASSDHMHTMTGECSCQHLRAARGRVGRAAGGPEQAGGQTLPHPREQTGHRERKRPGSQGAHWAKVGPSTVPFPVCPKPGLYVGGGSRGPRAFWCIWCARTTGSPHTQDRAASRRRAAGGGQRPPLRSRGARWPSHAEVSQESNQTPEGALCGFRPPGRPLSCLEHSIVGASFGLGRRKGVSAVALSPRRAPGVRGKQWLHEGLGGELPIRIGA